MRISLMDFINLEKELKKIFKNRNHIKQKEKTGVIRMQYVFH